MNINNINSVNNVIIAEKPFNPVSFLMLVEIFSKYKEYFVYCRVFCFELIYFCTIKK